MKINTYSSALTVDFKLKKKLFCDVKGQVEQLDSYRPSTWHCTGYFLV